MSKKSSWDSDEELLGDAPGGNTYAKSAELEVLAAGGEFEDEDALLSLEHDATHTTDHNPGGFDNSEQELMQDEQAFVFEEVDTGDLEDELNVGGEEESGYQDQVYEGDGDYDENYHAENVAETSEHLEDSENFRTLVPDPVSESVSYDESEAVSVSYDNTGGDDGTVELQYGQESEREVVLQYGDGGDLASSELQHKADESGDKHLESESDSEDEDSRRNRGRFKTERPSVASLSTPKERTTIPDTLEINDEQAAQINKFMSDKPPPQKGGKRAGGNRRQSVHSRLGPRHGLASGPREAQGPGMLQGPRPPFPVGLQSQLNPRMLMGIIRSGGMQALRGILPADLIRPGGPLGIRPLSGPGPRGPLSDGPMRQRGPLPLRLGHPGGMNMRGRMQGPRGPNECGPFPPRPQQQGPFPGPNRGPPPGMQGPIRGPPPGMQGPIRGPPPGMQGPVRGPAGLGQRNPFGGPPPRGPPGPSNQPQRGVLPDLRGAMEGPPRGIPQGHPQGLHLRPPNAINQMRGSGPAHIIHQNQMRGPPPKQPMIRPLIPNEPPQMRGILRSPSPLRSPGAGNSNMRGQSIHDRLGRRVQLRSGPENTSGSREENRTSGIQTSTEGQPIPSLVKSVSTPAFQQPGMNQGNRPQFNPRMGNAKGPRPMMSQNNGRQGSGPGKIFINPRFKNQEEGDNQGMNRTVKIGAPFPHRRGRGLLDRERDNSDSINRVSVVSLKRRSTGADEIPNKIVRLGNNQQMNQGQQNLRSVVDGPSERNIVFQRRDNTSHKSMTAKRRDLGRRLGPQVQGQQMSGKGSSVQSRLGPPISRPNQSQNVNFDPSVAPPNLRPRGPPPHVNPPRPVNPSGPPPQSSPLFSQPPPSIQALQGPPPVAAVNRFASPPPGSALLTTRFSGPPPAVSSAPGRFSAPPPAINLSQPPPAFNVPPPRLPTPVSQQPPAFHPAPPPVSTPAYAQPASQIPPHYPVPAVAPVPVATYSQPPVTYPVQTYAPPPAAAAPVVHPTTQPPPPTTVYQAVQPYSATPSVAHPYQQPPSQPAPAAATYAPVATYKPAVAPSYQPPQAAAAPPPPQIAAAAPQPAASQQYSYDYYSANNAHYQTPTPTVASQVYQAPQHSYAQSSYYDYATGQQATSSISTQAPHSSTYDNQAIQQITTIGRRAQPATDSQMRSIIHNVSPSKASTGSHSHSSGRIVVDTNVSVLKGPQKVAIYNLAQMATKETLVKVCRHFGRVMNVQLIRDENKAVVQFETGDQAAKCVSKCDQKCLHKSRLTVKLLPH